MSISIKQASFSKVSTVHVAHLLMGSMFVWGLRDNTYQNATTAITLVEKMLTWIEIDRFGLLYLVGVGQSSFGVTRDQTMKTMKIACKHRVHLKRHNLNPFHIWHVDIGL